MEYETVPLQQLLQEIASRTASEEDADAIRLAADTLDERGVSGEIIDMEYSDEIGVYYGSIRCPKCEVALRYLGVTREQAQEMCDRYNAGERWL